MKARSMSWPGSQARPVAHNAAAMKNEIHTWAFQALVSLRMALSRSLNMAAIVHRDDPGIKRSWAGCAGFPAWYLLPILVYMSTTQDLVTALKAELKSAGIT